MKSRFEEIRLIKIGNVYGDYDGMGFGGNVWSKGGLAPCLKSTSAASQQFTVIERKKKIDNKR